MVSRPLLSLAVRGSGPPATILSTPPLTHTFPPQLTDFGPSDRRVYGIVFRPSPAIESDVTSFSHSLIVGVDGDLDICKQNEDVEATPKIV